VNAMRGTERAGRCVTDAEGRFRIPGLAAGSLTIGAKRTFSEFASVGADLAQGETRRIELTLPPSAAGGR